MMTPNEKAEKTFEEMFAIDEPKFAAMLETMTPRQLARMLVNTATMGQVSGIHYVADDLAVNMACEGIPENTFLEGFKKPILDRMKEVARMTLEGNLLKEEV